MSTAEATGVQRIGDAFAGHGKRAALMPYVMGGFPTLEESARIGEACIASGADVIELGMPYSDPLADGPVIHAAGTKRAGSRGECGGCARGGTGALRQCPRRADVLLQHGLRARGRGIPGPARAQRRQRPDRPRSASAEATEVLAACDERGLALVPLVAPTSTPERLAAIGAQARGFLYTVSVVGTTGERGSLRGELRRGRRASKGVHAGSGRAGVRDRHSRAGVAGRGCGRRRRDRRHQTGAGGG